MIEVFHKGGWVMYPILLGSILGLALFLERLFALRHSRINPSDLLHQLMLLIRSGRFTEGRGLCQGHHSSLARLMRVALSHEGEPRDQLKSILEDAGQREAYTLERGVGALGAVASLEPLMGLLGTVLGMIDAFRQVETAGVGDPKVVASGIWVALITTAAGLLVAIPCYVGYRFLLGRVDRLLLELQEDALLLVEAMVRPPATESRAPAADPVTKPPTSPAPPAPPAPSSSDPPLPPPSLPPPKT